MKKLLFYALIIPLCINVKAGTPDSSAEWVSNMRIVSLTHPETPAKYNEELFRQTLDSLKNNGVNTIMDYGSL